MTLLAAGVLGGAFFVANAGTKTADPVVGPAAATAAAATPGGTGELALSGIPVAGTPATDQLGLSGLRVAGATDIPATGNSLALAEIPVVGPAAAPAAEEPAPGGRPYAGKTKTGGLTVAIAMNDGKGVAYVCDGKGVEAWLSGAAEGSTFELKSKSGRSVMGGTISADGVTGKVTVDGVDHSYSADATDVAAARARGRADVAKVADRAGLDYR